jgi:hypothetical protein
MSLTIAPLTQATIPHMVAVINGVTGQRLEPPRWQRKYGPGGPAGPGKGFVLYDCGAPVGCIGAIHFRVEAGRQILSGWQLCDIFIAKGQRNGRATPMLYESLMGEIWRDGGDLTFGFCNPMSGALLKRRLGHQEISRIDPFEIALAPAGRLVAKLRRRLWAPLALARTGANDLPPGMVQAPALDASGQPAFWRVKHDGNYLASRRAMGARVVTIRGRRLLLSPGGVLKVGGMEPVGRAELPALLAELHRFGQHIGAGSIRFMVDRRDPLHEQLSATLGPPPEGWFLTAAPRPGGMMPAEGMRVCFADYENFCG